MSAARRALAAAIAALLALAAAPQRPLPDAAREAAHRANNRGVALLEQYRYAEAADALREALALDPELGIAHLNLALALLYLPDLAGSRAAALAAQPRLPGRLQVPYLLGLIAKAENRSDDALAAFRQVLEGDPGDVGANVQLGQVLTGLRRYDEAAAALRTALDHEPWNGTAAYGLGMALTRAGQREAGRAMIEHFQQLRGAPQATLLSEVYLEQGRYASGLTASGAEPELVERAAPDVRYQPLALAPRDTAAAQAPGGIALFDADGDGDLDVCDAGAPVPRLLRNDAGRFTESPLPALPAAQGVLAGDLDGDARPELVLLDGAGLRLLRHAGGLSFEDATAQSGLASAASGARAGALSDVDHDGDLDLVVLGPNRLWRNDGSGRFEDVTDAAGLIGSGRSVAVVASDFDERRDVDLLLVRSDAAPALLRNRRDGSFEDVATSAGLALVGPALAVAAGDLDKNGSVDFLFAVADAAPRLALGDGRGGFDVSEGPEPLRGAAALQFLDYDNDGLLDIVGLAGSRPAVFRNLGDGFEAVPAAVAGGRGAAVGLASGDLDGDGDTDLVTRGADGSLTLWRNAGGERRRSLSVRLAGRVSNRSGVGAKLELRAGSLAQKLETYAASPAPAPADVVFGLGGREGADAVRVLWPAGILQTEIGAAGAPLGSPLRVEELDRKPSSCPYLYTWNGSRFEFVSDFLGGGELGYWAAPGIRNLPDPVEYVRIPREQLVARDGRFELRVTNELEEALFLDGVRLHVIAHPPELELHPSEGMTRVAKPFELIAVRGARPVARAVDERGRDQTDAVSRSDRRYADGFALLPLRGYAEQHALLLELGPDADQAVLLLEGWTDYAFSSDNLAAAQRGWALRPPSLEVRGADGRWHTALEEIGIPVGRPQTVVVELAGLWRGPSREVRLSTNMRVYWDQIRVGRRERVELPTRVLAPLRAELRTRGYSAERAESGAPARYDYQRVSWDAPWKRFPGRYTREGDVRELLQPGDDAFVFSRPGDELALTFDAAAAPLPPGWSWTFLLYADGYSKEMDLNSSTPDAIGPLPFHAMRGYPYGPEQSYPMSEALRALYERYNTRQVGGLLPSLEWSALAARAALAESGAR